MLQGLADSLQVNERILRRAWALGTLRGTRTTPYRLELPVAERIYLRRHWSTLSSLRGALRTEPNVSMAVVFGSVWTRPRADRRRRNATRTKTFSLSSSYDFRFGLLTHNGLQPIRICPSLPPRGPPNE
jgi:hypothetical protein